MRSASARGSWQLSTKAWPTPRPGGCTRMQRWWPSSRSDDARARRGSRLCVSLLRERCELIEQPVPAWTDTPRVSPDDFDRPHDRLFRYAFERPEIAEGELRTLLPPDVVE